MRDGFFDVDAAAARDRRIPTWRWTLWFSALAIAMVLFYVVLTPVWLGLRWAAWVAEFRARRRPVSSGEMFANSDNFGPR